MYLMPWPYSCPHVARHKLGVYLHTQAAGHALLGDTLYGVTGPWLQRHALHAAVLCVAHPVTRAPLLLAAPLPGDIREALSALGMAAPTPEQLLNLLSKDAA